MISHISKDYQRIKRFISSQVSPITADEVAERLGTDKTGTVYALRRMSISGECYSCGTSRRGHYVRVYSNRPMCLEEINNVRGSHGLTELRESVLSVLTDEPQKAEDIALKISATKNEFNFIRASVLTGLIKDGKVARITTPAGRTKGYVRVKT